MIQPLHVSRTSLHLEPHWGDKLVEDEPQLFKPYYNDIPSLIGELKKTTNITLKGKVYVSPTCNIPRDKLKAYFKENNLERTTRLYLADTVLLDLPALDMVMQKLNSKYSWEEGYLIESKEIKPHLESLKQAYSNKSWFQDHVEGVINELRDNDHKAFIITSNAYSNIKTHHSEKFILTNFPEGTKTSIIRNRADAFDKVVNLIKTLHSTKLPLVFDSVISENMTSDGIELDKDIEEQIIQLMETNDIDNIKMAIEIMSNFDLEKSLLNVANIFNTYGEILRKTSYFQKTSHKQIDSYLRSKKIHWKGERLDFLNTLFVHFQDQPEQLSKVKGFIQSYLQNHIKQTKIKITDISLAL